MSRLPTVPALRMYELNRERFRKGATRGGPGGAQGAPREPPRGSPSPPEAREGLPANFGKTRFSASGRRPLPAASGGLRRLAGWPPEASTAKPFCGGWGRKDLEPKQNRNGHLDHTRFSCSIQEFFLLGSIILCFNRFCFNAMHQLRLLCPSW